MSKPILYCPLTDWLIIQQAYTRAEKELSHPVVLKGKNKWQDAIMEYPFATIPERKLMLLGCDSIIGDYTEHEELKEFIKKHHMNLSISMPKFPQGLKKELVALSIMRVFEPWTDSNKTEELTYTISQEDSKTGEEITVKGFSLRDSTFLTDENGNVVAAKI